MRATISFETDVDQVEGTMAVVACSEEHNLRAAADILGNYTVLDGSLLDAITEALRLLDMSATQLRQYQQMMVSFERARLGAMSDTDAPAAPPVNSLRDVQAAVAAMNQFDGFVDKINTAGSEEDSEDEEG